MNADFSSDPTGTGATALREAVASCAALVRRYDRDRYTAALFAAPEDRMALVALYAFNLELARVRETVSEAALGDIRLQWWRETLDAIYAGAPVRQHPVAIALAAAVSRRKLDRFAFERLIEGRAFDLADSQPETLDDLVGYAAATAGELGALAATALDAEEQVVDAARHAGTAWGLSGLLRAVPFHAARRRIYLPRADIPEDAAQRILLSGRVDASIAASMARIAARAREMLSAARAQSATLPRRMMPALLPSALIDGDLLRLERAGYDVFALRPAAPLPRMIRLWVALRRRRI